MSSLINKSLPTEFKFSYIAIDKADSESEACKFPQPLDLSKFEGKTIVITGAPAAFSPTCSVSHIPGYIQKLDDLVAKGVDQVIVVTVDNPFANNAWAKSLGVKDTKHIKFATDSGCAFTSSLGLELNLDDGTKWCGRYALIVSNGTITYAGKEENPATDVTVSSVESVLKHL